MVRVFLEKQFDKLTQRLTHRVEFDRESEQSRAADVATIVCQLVVAHLYKAALQQIELLTDDANRIELRTLIVRQSGAPHGLALILRHIFKKLCKSAEQIDFGENKINRHLDTEGIVDLIDAFPDLACVNSKLLAVVLY